MQVVINGEPSVIAEGTNLKALVQALGLTPERVAVEHNRQVVRRAEWQETLLADGDYLEIVHFVGGG